MFRGLRKPSAKWLRSDTLLASALLLHLASLCPDCDQPRDEAMDPANDGSNPWRTSEYVITEPVRDHACTAMSQARKKIADADMAHPDGIRIGINLVPVVRPSPGGPSQPPT